MRTKAVTELQASLSETLARVKAGEEVVVTEGGRPIAKIVPLADPEQMAATGLGEVQRNGPSQAHIDELIRAGILRPPLRRLSEDFWTRPMPQDPEGHVLAALLADREEEDY